MKLRHFIAIANPSVDKGNAGAKEGAIFLGFSRRCIYSISDQSFCFESKQPFINAQELGHIG